MENTLLVIVVRNLKTGICTTEYVYIMKIVKISIKSTKVSHIIVLGVIIKKEMNTDLIGNAVSALSDSDLKIIMIMQINVLKKMILQNLQKRNVLIYQMENAFKNVVNFLMDKR